MKPGARIAAFSSGPIKRGSGAKVLLVGVVSKQGQVEGILSGRIRTDGDDSARTIEGLVSGSRFRDQVKIVALNGVALAGLNVVDLKHLKSKGYEHVILTRSRQRHSLLIRAIRLNKGRNTNKERLVREQAEIRQLRAGDFYIRASTALPKVMVREIYEALRLSHMISNGISTGESKGRI
ncbi:MAG: DUF99 family protein [Candidatus Micrarchaeota archaeon]|nr:DUF99 family protein [Candidatus Micrarchaeota archaeon]